VGIAFPTKHFELVDSVIKRISESKTWPKQHEADPQAANGGALVLVTKPFAAVTALLRALILAPAQAMFGSLLALMPTGACKMLTGAGSKEKKCPWAVSESKKNTMIFLRTYTCAMQHTAHSAHCLQAPIDTPSFTPVRAVCKKNMRRYHKVELHNIWMGQITRTNASYHTNGTDFTTSLLSNAGRAVSHMREPCHMYE